MSQSTRTALITGSGKKRIGWHLADALARRGYAIAVHYHRSADEAMETVDHLRRLDVAAEAFQADLANADAARSLVDSVLARFGRLDVLATCAAIWEPKRLEEVTTDDLRRYFDVNLAGTFVCAQAAGLTMVRQPEGGAIVTFGDWAVRRPYLDHAAYFAAKGAIPTLTRCLAVELGTRNPRVRVNCIEPGPAMVPDSVDPDERAAIARATLVGREGSPEAIVQAALLLIENDFLTGVCLPVDGGRSIYAGGL
ncbi:MAG: oxidoreductase [Isosphaeraceae bacterium]|jgi:pteridine reductase|nr:MAG: oxidoreductase [Isosphaeraceae bacterium]